MKNENKLKGRDLINIGIFDAIYFAIIFAIAMLGMIPIFLPLLSVFDGRRHVIEPSEAILARANQALATLERYKARLNETSARS